MYSNKKKLQLIEQERAHKLELLSIVISQFLSEYYNIHPKELMLKNDMALSLHALRESYQNYLIFLQFFYKRTFLSFSDNVSWLHKNCVEMDARNRQNREG